LTHPKVRTYFSAYLGKNRWQSQTILLGRNGYERKAGAAGLPLSTVATLWHWRKTKKPREGLFHSWLFSQENRPALPAIFLLCKAAQK